jgi:putative molybdopterin biosynthesis protein
VTGKLLFPRDIYRSLARRHTEFGTGQEALKSHDPVVAGSHDPLLEWALRESGAGLAVLSDGSFDGLKRLASGTAMAAGSICPSGRRRLQCRLGAPASGRSAGGGDRMGQAPPGARFAARQSGPNRQPCRSCRLKAHPAPGGLGRPHAARPAAGRPAGARSRHHALDPPARSEADVAHAVATGHADAGLAIAAAARQYGLDFLPLAEERYDLVIWRRDFFDEPIQRLMGFCRQPAFAERADELGGYDLSGFGRVHYNGP